MTQAHRKSPPIAMALTAALSPHAMAQANAPLALPPLATVEVGIICAADLSRLQPTPAPDTREGHVETGRDPGLRIDVATTDVPARLGVGFGPELQLTTDAAPRVLRMELTHPPMGDTAITQQAWSVPLSAGERTVAFYIFEHTSELVPGTWTFRLFDAETRVFEQAFEVYDPDAPNGPKRPCFGKERDA
jgi:hypothetical protein